MHGDSIELLSGFLSLSLSLFLFLFCGLKLDCEVFFKSFENWFDLDFSYDLSRLRVAIKSVRLQFAVLTAWL